MSTSGEGICPRRLGCQAPERARWWYMLSRVASAVDRSKVKPRRKYAVVVSLCVSYCEAYAFGLDFSEFFHFQVPPVGDWWRLVETC
jgi:hypothetical protein